MKSIKESIHNYLNLSEESNNRSSHVDGASSKTLKCKDDDTDERLDLIKIIMANWSHIWGESLNDKVAIANIQGNEIVVIANDTNVATYIKTIYYDIIDRINGVIKASGLPRPEATGNNPASEHTMAGGHGDDVSGSKHIENEHMESSPAIEHIRIVVVGKSVSTRQTP
jgi:hypothetical protein